MIYSIHNGDTNFTNSRRSQAVRYYGSTLTLFPVRAQKVLRVYWLGGRMHSYGKFFIADLYSLSPNKVMTMTATCGHITMVHLARQLGATHTKKAMNMAAYGGHTHVVRSCYNYDKVNLDKVIEWAAEGGHEALVHLCRELGATDLDSATL